MFLVLLQILLFATFAAAAETTAGSSMANEQQGRPQHLFQSTSENTPEANSGSRGVSATRVIGVRDFLVTFILLGIIVMMILAFSWMIKKTGWQPGQGNQVIRILSSVAIGQKEKLALVAVGEQQLLIAISPGNIQKLMILEKNIDIDSSASSAEGLQKFSEIFRQKKQGS